MNRPYDLHRVGERSRPLLSLNAQMCCKAAPSWFVCVCVSVTVCRCVYAVYIGLCVEGCFCIRNSVREWVGYSLCMYAVFVWVHVY